MARGDGRIYRRGQFFWICYYLRGTQYREPAKSKDGKSTSDPEVATKFLRARLKQVHADECGGPTFLTPKATRLTIRELVEALRRDYEVRGKLSSQSASHLDRVDADFGDVRAITLTAEQIDAYVARRVDEGHAPSSINRTTQLLGQSYKLAIRRGHLSQAPAVPHLSEAGNERQGFFTDHEFRSVQAHLPADLKDFAEYGFLTGSRSGEIKLLTWDMVQGDEIRIPGPITKNRKPRIIPLEGQLAELIARRRTARRVELNGVVELSKFIFHRVVHGQIVPVNGYRKSWATACVAAGLGTMICPKCQREGTERKCPQCKVPTRYRGQRRFHDFRRSACRNMVQAGVSPQVAMQLSGHRTDSMFRRYAIVITDDLREAQKKTDAYRKSQEQKVVAVGRLEA